MRRNIIREVQVRELAPGTTPDDYADRLVKMIPAEIVSLYLFLQSYISNGNNTHNWLLWTVLVILSILTPLYLKKIMGVDSWVQQLLTTLAFLFWSCTFGFPYDDIISKPDELKMISTVLLALYTFAVPIFYK